MGRGQNTAAEAASANTRGGDDRPAGEIASLADEGVGNLADYTGAVAAAPDREDNVDPADRKAVTSLRGQLSRSPKFSRLPAERLTELAEQLYAKAYQNAVLGQADASALKALASMRGQNVAELQVELERERNA